MLEKYAEALRGLHGEEEAAVMRGLNLPRYPGALYEMLEEAGYYQSDVVLVLLREDTPGCLRAAEQIIGRPIARCPVGLRRTPERVSLSAGIDQVMRSIGLVDRSDARKFTWKQENWQLPTTDSWQRFRIIRIGMTVGQFLIRGGHRRDVVDWSRAGKVRLSAA